MSWVWQAALAVVIAVLIGVNLDFWLPHGPKADIEYLQPALLQLLGKTQVKGLKFVDESKRTFEASGLWKHAGAVIMVEAVELSSLKPELDAHGVPLYAVIHETLGYEEFLPYFKGDVFLDKDRHFYGPEVRELSGVGLLRLSSFVGLWQARQKQVEGNLKGDGWTLGGIFVIGAQGQGVLLDHRDKDFGDSSNKSEILKAVKKIVPVKLE